VCRILWGVLVREKPERDSVCAKVVRGDNADCGGDKMVFIAFIVDRYWENDFIEWEFIIKLVRASPTSVLACGIVRLDKSMIDVVIMCCKDSRVVPKVRPIKNWRQCCVKVWVLDREITVSDVFARAKITVGGWWSNDCGAN